MTQSSSSTDERSWNEMQYDILIKIFMYLNIMDLGKSVSLVCKSWRQTCSDPIFWNKIDLSRLRSNSLIVPNTPYSWSDVQSSERLTHILRNLFYLSNGNANCLIFHFFLFIKDEHLITVAQRSPNLKRLVLPGWSNLSETGIDNAMQYWGGLESMTTTSILSPYSLVEAIGKYCENFSELKITCHFNVGLAEAIIKNIPKLKVLSLRCMVLNLEALVLVVNSLEHLEVLNICHSLIMKEPDEANNIMVYRQSEVPNILKVSLRLKRLITCQGDCCIRCRDVSRQNRRREWYELQELLWGEDEITSLAR